METPRAHLNQIQTTVRDALVANPDNLSIRSRFRLWRQAKGLSAKQVTGGKGNASLLLWEANPRAYTHERPEVLERYLAGIGMTHEEFMASSPLTSRFVPVHTRLLLWASAVGVTLSTISKACNISMNRFTEWGKNGTNLRYVPKEEHVAVVQQYLGIPDGVLYANIQRNAPAGGITTISKRRSTAVKRNGFATRPDLRYSEIRRREQEAAKRDAEMPVSPNNTDADIAKAYLNLLSARKLIDTVIHALEGARDDGLSWDVGPLVRADQTADGPVD